MTDKHIIIIGGGLAGLSAGCYARHSGFRTTIIEHNLALGGVCTAWERGPYTIDGCIHWLTGGPFLRLYEELGIAPPVKLRTLDHFATYRDVHEGFEVPITRDIEALLRALVDISPEDGDELRRCFDGAAHLASMAPGPEQPAELMGLRESLASLWGMRHDLGTIMRFHEPVEVWTREHLKSERVRRVFTRLVPGDAPALFTLFMLGYLGKGYLSRPEGGTARFRDALIDTYHRLGGEERLHATVDEVLVEGARARGVRLADGELLPADMVISTSSAPETVLRLLGGRYGADDTRRRLSEWKLFQPIVLASFGVAAPLSSAPATLIIDGIKPFEVGGYLNHHLYVRIYNDDPSFAPAGHTVVQALLATDYTWWATRGTRYGAEKDAVAEAALEQLSLHLPGLRDAVRIIDVSTPLTFWNMTRSWRGAYEGWVPTADSFFGHIKKTLPGLSGFYMAGQWVEPGGGVPTAILSGRQAVQILCADEGRPFAPPSASAA